MAEAEAVMGWGTWEELVLAGAIQRHGFHSWDAIAAEVRSRTRFPDAFTPQACEARYLNILERYAGSNDWYEELRKRRVNELKRAIEQSEDSIGSLQSILVHLTSQSERLEHLNAQSGSVGNSEKNVCRTESPSLSGNVDCIDMTSKDVSKDGSSAGSFTEEFIQDCPSRCELLPSTSMQEHEKTKLSEVGKERVQLGVLNFVPLCCKKKRGNRKRKWFLVRGGESIGDADTLIPAIQMDKEEASESCELKGKQSNEEASKFIRDGDIHIHLAGIMDLVLEHKDALKFRNLLDEQNRARYKKIIRQHLDIRGICSRISSGTISSEKELFRDLLLLCNNILVYYSKNSAEYKSAYNLRDIVTKILRQNLPQPSGSNIGRDIPSVEAIKPKKPAHIRPCNQKTPDSKGTKNWNCKRRKLNAVEASIALSDRKRGIAQAVKSSNGGIRPPQQNPIKARRRVHGR